MLINAWQYAPPVEPVGSDGGISDPLRFVPPAAAEEAYLVTELGNVFPVNNVEDAHVGSNTGIDNNTRSAYSRINMFLMGLSPKIVGTDASLEYIVGSNSGRNNVPYVPVYTIPSNIVTSGSGYVAALHDDVVTNASSISIPQPFASYVYSSHSEQIYRTSSDETVPAADSIAIVGHHDSRKAHGAVSSDNDGFNVYSTGTYVVKLRQGMIYGIDDGIDCVGGSCDKISIIKSDSDLLQTTSSGLHLLNSQTATISQEQPYDLTFDNYLGNELRWGVTIDMTASINAGNARISHPNNVIISGLPVVFSFNENVYCKANYYAHSSTYSYKQFANNFTITSLALSTQTTGGLTSLNSVYVENTDRISWWNSKSNDDQYYCPTPYISRDRPYLSNLQMDRSVSIFDRGVPIREHVAYWGQNASDSMYGLGLTTVYNPSVVSVNDNDTYMIVDKTSHVGSIGIWSVFINQTNGLLISNLPSNTLYKIYDDVGISAYGVTSNDGKIELPSTMFSTVGNLSFSLLPDSVVMKEMTGMTVYDTHSRASFNVQNSTLDGNVYGATQYLRLPVILDMKIDDVTLNVDGCETDGMPLPYLAREYLGGERVMVPVVPGFDTICITADGTQTVMRYSDASGGISTAVASDAATNISTDPNYNWQFGGRYVQTNDNDYDHVVDNKHFVFITQTNPLTSNGANPVYKRHSVGTTTNLIAIHSGEIHPSVSGSVTGKITTELIKEYQRDLSTPPSNVEDSTVQAYIAISKNGIHLRTDHLATLAAVSHMTDTNIESLTPEKFIYYRSAKPSGESWFAPLYPEQSTPNSGAPWYHCETVVEHKHYGFYYDKTRKSNVACSYKQYSTTQHVCELSDTIRFQDTFSNDLSSISVSPGDIISYRVYAVGTADFRPLNCGNNYNGAYGETTISLNLRNIKITHDMT